MELLKTTPREDGFRMPGEFELHAGTWMAWPERADTWRCDAKYAKEVFVKIATAISEFEPVTVCANPSQYNNAKEMLPNNIRVLEIENNDCWMRDIGPTFVVNDKGDVRGIDWTFNSWGGLVDGLYSPWDKDDRVAKEICEIENVKRYRTENFVLEGGAIHVDGEGTAIVVSACLLSEGRNPHMTKDEIENKLKDYLNVEKVIWLERGIYLDETNEHVDNVCAYVKPGVVVLAWTDDETDPQYEMSKVCYETLKNETDAKGRKFEIHKLYVPKPIHSTDEEADGLDIVSTSKLREAESRLAASYVNYYVANGGVIVPVFGDDNDEKAIKKLEELYPDRKVVPIYTREVLLGGGNIHCITQQQPKGIVK